MAPMLPDVLLRLIERLTTLNARAFAGVGPITDRGITTHPILKEVPVVTLPDDLLSSCHHGYSEEQGSH
jgi:hypothetical protein